MCEVHCQRQAIPARFLEQVLHAMKKAGGDEPTRGSQEATFKPEAVRVVRCGHSLCAGRSAVVGKWGCGVKAPPLEPLKQEPCWRAFGDRVGPAELSVLSEVTVEELAKRQRARGPAYTDVSHLNHAQSCG